MDGQDCPSCGPLFERLTTTAQVVKLKVGVWAVEISRGQPKFFFALVREPSLAGNRIWKLLILLFIVLLLFSSRLPSVARSLGQSVIEFKKGIKELENSSDDEKSA